MLEACPEADTGLGLALSDFYKWVDFQPHLSYGELKFGLYIIRRSVRTQGAGK